MKNSSSIAIIGGGLSGSECAHILSLAGLSVDIYEMKPFRYSDAHRSSNLAELVCSNSLKSKNIYNPQGLLKEEMKRFGSLIIRAAEETMVLSGESLSVDRELFSKFVTEVLMTNERIKIFREEIEDIFELAKRYDIIIIATGPLSSEGIVRSIQDILGADKLLYFYDAVSPIVTFDSIDMSKAFKASRYNRGGDDYINCPINEDEYKRLYDVIINAEYVESHIDESLKFFEGCLPVEEIARRGYKSLSFGPFKPVGLGFDKSNMPYAVVQLRPENRSGTLYSVVAFQTRMKYGYQEKALRVIPALRNCEIVRYGQMHRNIYLNSPDVLNKNLSFRNEQRVFVAGTLTGVEGYVEAAASGILVALSVISMIKQKEFIPPPDMTAMGLLYRYITGEISVNKAFAPTNINKGLFLHNGARRYSEKMAEDAIKKIEEYISHKFI